MKTDAPLAEELQIKGFRALVDALGPADALRFLRQYGPGEGDYTAERQARLDDRSVEEILAEIREHRP